ncbi:KH domain-containing protein [Tanacetum coccineum]
MLPNQGFNELDRLRHRSPSPMASSNLMSNVPGSRISGWNGLPPEFIDLIVILAINFIEDFRMYSLGLFLLYRKLLHPYTLGSCNGQFFCSLVTSYKQGGIYEANLMTCLLFDPHLMACIASASTLATMLEGPTSMHLFFSW